MKLKIWTEAYSPFIMGGDVNAPIATEVEVGEPVKIADGISVYLIASPVGNTYVAEATTGAFVGTDLSEVKSDIESGDLEMMKRQIAEASERVKKATILDPEKFWGRFRT